MDSFPVLSFKRRLLSSEDKENDDEEKFNSDVNKKAKQTSNERENIRF